MRRKSPEREEAEEFLWELWRAGMRPREKLRPSAWISRNFARVPIDFERFPWLVEPADTMADYRVEEQLLLGPTQIGKSLTTEGGICYFIVEDPGDLVAYTHTIPLAKQWAEERVIPSVRQCPAVRPLLPIDYRLIRQTGIIFGHMVLEISPANETQTQQKTRRIVFCDERSLWDSGLYYRATRRAASPAFAGRRKIISSSNAGDFESEVEVQWRLSDQRVLYSDCPACGKPATYKFSEKKCRRVPAKEPGFWIEFEDSERTRPLGVWDEDETLKTVRLVCPHCAARLEDTPKVRLALRRSMRYQPLNLKASVRVRAWAISGVAVYPWTDLVLAFIRATQSLELGDMESMRQFMLNGLNEPWSEDVIFDTTTNASGDYEFSKEPWAESEISVMTIDVQELAPYFWYVLRDWKRDGKSRLRLCGFANSWGELRDIQKRERLVDNCVIVDVGHDPKGEVHERTADWAWICFRGSPIDTFLHTAGRKVPVRRYFSEMKSIDPAIGTDQQGGRRRAREILWGDRPVKDILARLYTGKGVYFGVPRNVPQFYLNHMAAERKQVVKQTGTGPVRAWVRIGKRPNHCWDCEAMQIAWALMAGVLRIRGADEQKSEDDPGSR